jgi:P-type Ca2+ transporter type 2C
MKPIITTSCAAFNLELPFSTIQILWANIIADIPPSLALGVEPFETDIMDRPPKPTAESVLNVESVVAMVIQGLIISVSSFVVYILSQGPPIEVSLDNVTQLLTAPNNILFATHQTLKEQRSVTFFFLTSLQLVQGFLSQSIINSSFKIGLLRNGWMVVAIAVSFALLVAGFYVPG